MQQAARPHNTRGTQRALGRRLAERRKATGSTQHCFAPTRYGRSTIANPETGHQRPKHGLWQRCDEVLQTGGLLRVGYDSIVAFERQHRRFSSAAVGFAATGNGLPAAYADALAPRYRDPTRPPAAEPGCLDGLVHADGAAPQCLAGDRGDRA